MMLFYCGGGKSVRVTAKISQQAESFVCTKICLFPRVLARNLLPNGTILLSLCRYEMPGLCTAIEMRSGKPGQ